MKCPNCNYIDGYAWIGEGEDEDGNGGEYVDVDGKYGGFYYLPINVRRDRSYYSPEEEGVKACPSCGILFIDT